ncbi:hypothetical protein A1D23_08480 [Chelonobacter oris]|uniref:DUF596 domain-containing protein n=1 Tax=Chelonobacter oris TaxID=505317 RepID=UPI00244C3A1E|nr:DUF596 domain-containing protein [Chelonobacter oris]MDH3000213.1 hypothetical protein [Chelonobacter oris]
MYRRYLKLYKDDKELLGSIEEQIDLLRRNWPDYYDENEPMYDIDNLWWFVDKPNTFWENSNDEER